MDLSSSILTVHLVPDWLKRLLEDCHEEARQQRVYPIKLIKGESRIAVWNLCAHLGFKNHGLPGLACRLLEQYLSIIVHRVFPSVNQEDWEEYKANIMAKVPLLIATCLQLAAKMSSVTAEINSYIIRAKLLCKGIRFTIDEINATEFEVYSTLGFRIPLWTNVEVARLLALEVGIPPVKLGTVAAAVNLAEFKRDLIEEKVLEVADLSPLMNKTSSVRELHLSAGAVLCAGRVLDLSGPELAMHLSELTRAPIDYIECISDLLCSIILANDDHPPPKRPSKRKMAL